MPDPGNPTAITRCREAGLLPMANGLMLGGVSEIRSSAKSALPKLDVRVVETMDAEIFCPNVLLDTAMLDLLAPSMTW